jgi:hypothetical protein
MSKIEEDDNSVPSRCTVLIGLFKNYIIFVKIVHFWLKKMTNLYIF